MEKAQETLIKGDLAAQIDFIVEHWWAILAGNAFTIFVFVAMPCAIILPIVFRKKITLERGGVAASVSETFSAAFLNVGIIVMLAVYAAQFLSNIILPPLAEYLTRVAQ